MFDRPSNDTLRISRDTLLYIVGIAGPRPAEEEVERASTTRKEGVRDSGIRRSANGCLTGAGNEATDLLGHPVRVGGLELERDGPPRSRKASWRVKVQFSGF